MSSKKEQNPVLCSISTKSDPTKEDSDESLLTLKQSLQRFLFFTQLLNVLAAE